MLAAQRMGSNGGQQSFPFGYDLDNLHGIGLPNFMSPGPPPGQPLLNEHDNQTLNSFFSGFEAGGDASKHGHMMQFGSESSRGQAWTMPPTFVGSETSFKGRAGVDWQTLPQQGDYAFGADPNLTHMPHNAAYDNAHVNNYSMGQFDSGLLHHIHSAAHADMVDPNFGPAPWQQGGYHDHPAASLPSKPPMRFGSDQHFQPGGYAAPEGQFEPAPPSLDWLEPHSSANNTQPNTTPNTQPSSPVWTKKRKLDDYQDTSQPHMNQHPSRNSLPSPIASKQKTSKRKDQTPLTPRSGRPSDIPNDDDSSDNHSEKDDHPESASPDSWHASKSRPSKSGKASPSKTAGARRKSTASNTPVKLKSKPSRSGGIAASNNSRVPLTADQKKANHTNSEQRRRDATAKAYAELYDLIPELNDLGKQSTMKKLEIVVAKVARVKERVAYLRSVLGFDGETGAPQATTSLYPNHGTSGATDVFEANGSWQG